MIARFPPRFLAPSLYNQQTQSPPTAYTPKPNRQLRAQRRLQISTHIHRPTAHSRPFHSTPTRPQKPLPDHYATLQLAPGATPSSIKKSFYALSKTHHPDRTRSLPRPEAEDHERRFRAASEAYAVLGDATARQKYDRDRAAAGLGSSAASPYGGGSGSGHSAASANGGRRASGLSRRRTPFRGPPPSFYRSGGWGSGEAAERRRQHAEGHGQREQDQARASSGGGNGGGSSTAGGASAGAEDWPFGGDPNDVPHFNRRKHYKTQTTVEQQLRQGRQRRREEVLAERQRRRLDDDDDLIMPQDAGGTEMRNFFIVGGIIVVGCGGSAIFFGSR